MTYEPTPTKTCSKCGECKSATNEFFCKTSKGKLSAMCKECQRAKNKAYYEANLEKERSRAAMKNEQRKLSGYHRSEKVVAKKVEYYRKSKSANPALFSERNKIALKKYRERFFADPKNRLISRLRAMVRRNVLFSKRDSMERTNEILGCSTSEFIAHIERQFTDGMSWNHISGIHIDHIIPLATAKTVEDVMRLNHYTNLRPLWAIDNLRKGAKLDYQI